MKSILSFSLAAAAGVLFLIVSTSDKHERDARLDEYCAQVKRFQDSGGNAGHPDFRGIADLACRCEEEGSETKPYSSTGGDRSRVDCDNGGNLALDL